MHKVIVVGTVQDMKKWEEGFRTHADLFKTQSVISPIEFAAAPSGDQVAVLFQVGDLDTFHKVMGSSATADAMAQDGFERESAKIFVLDKKFGF